MSKFKSGTNIFTIIFKSFIIYVKNFPALTRVMLFPVFGQIIGIFMIFYPNYLYTEKYLTKFSGVSLEQNLVFILLGLILIILPGFAVFIKAFWDYMITMVSLNSMISDIVKKESHSDFRVYNNSVKLKTGNYVILLLLVTFFWLLVVIFPLLSFFAGLFIDSNLVAPIFMIMFLISAIFSVFLSVKLSLVFQVFAFESISPVEVIKKGWNILKRNFWRTVFMGSFLLVITCFFIPGLFTSIIEKTPLMSYLTMPFDAYINIFAENQAFMNFLVTHKMTQFGLAVHLAHSTVGATVTALMLPLGSACFTLLYFDILNRK